VRQRPERAFLVTQNCAEPSTLELRTIQRALGLACRRLTAAGTPIRLAATTYVPAQQRWLGLCVADSEQVVHAAAATAQLASIVVTEV
jgi:hypothetical protein